MTKIGYNLINLLKPNKIARINKRRVVGYDLFEKPNGKLVKGSAYTMQPVRMG